MKRRSFLAAAVLAVSAHFVRLPRVVGPYVHSGEFIFLEGEGRSVWHDLAVNSRELTRWIERVSLETPPFLSRP